MHILTVIQEDFPNSGKIDEFIKEVSSKEFTKGRGSIVGGWNKPRIREIRLFDIQLPEHGEEELLRKLSTYEVHKLGMRLIQWTKNPIMKTIMKFLHIVPVKHFEQENENNPRETAVRLAVLGKVEDFRDSKDKEEL